MKKFMSLLVCLGLVGCSSSSSATTATPEPVQTTTPEVEVVVTVEPTSEPTATPETLNKIEAVLDEELPSSLTVAIQDMTVILPKAQNYTCDSEIARGDELILYFEGEIQDRPEIVKVVKK